MCLYTRVSKDQQEGRSVDEQEADCRFWVSREETWDIVRVSSDPNVSASRYAKRERPGWLAMLEAIAADEIDIVVFWEMSRGTRNRREWADFAELAEDKRLHIMVGGRLYDATDPHDMAYLDHLVTRGVEEVGESRSRLNRTVKSQAEKGAPSGVPVWGTRSVYDPKKGRLIGRELDDTPWPHDCPETTPVKMIRAASESIRGGVGVWTVIAEWNQLGWHAPKGGLWYEQTLENILRSPGLMGKRWWNGEIQEAEWEYPWARVLEPQEWYELQAVLDVPSPYPEQLRSPHLKHYLSGIARCGRCGGRMGTGKARRSDTRIYRCVGLYAGAPNGCTGRAKHLAEEHVEVQVVAEFSRPDVLDRFRKPENASSSEDGERLAELRAELEAARRAAEQKGPGRLPIATLVRIETSLGEEIQELEKRLRPAPLNPLAAELASQNPGTVLARWCSWSPEKKRNALKSFTESVRILPVGRIGRRKLSPEESVEILWVSAEA